MAETPRRFPPIRHDDGTVTLWHPDSPGTRLRVRPSLLRRLRIVRSPFATLGESARYYRDRKRRIRPATEREPEARAPAISHTDDGDDDREWKAEQRRKDWNA